VGGYLFDQNMNFDLSELCQGQQSHDESMTLLVRRAQRLPEHYSPGNSPQLFQGHFRVQKRALVLSSVLVFIPF
jgi:hypothetical protein